MKVLFVLTSQKLLGNTREKTGFWIEELVTPYYILSDAGIDITIASPKGGFPPIDPKSELPNEEDAPMIRFNCDAVLRGKLSHSLKLASVCAYDYDAVFYPGGHGPLWDLPGDAQSIALLQSFYSQHKPMVLIGHGVCALLAAKTERAALIVAGKQVTAFSNDEEKAALLAGIVPFSIEDELKKSGGVYSNGANGRAHTVQDGLLITGQNPASAGPAAELLLSRLMPKAPLPVEATTPAANPLKTDQTTRYTNAPNKKDILL